jgi:hypothetical protein
MKKTFVLQAFLVSTLLCLSSFGAGARQAAFLSPGAVGFGAAGEAVKVEPKAEIEVGDTSVNVAKKATVFFVNQTSMAVKIEKVTISGDSTVSAEETANDCIKQGSIAPSSRCSVELSVMPVSPGSWSVDVLMTHGSAGRIARARLYGKTGGAGAAEKSTGLSISSKEIKPIDFGTVEVGDGKVSRSALMINDSPEAIKIQSIDVIAADNGLQKFTQGCSVDMELQPGASCPVTLLWEPQSNSPISTDLIIRHTGKLGFTVIPIRGNAKGGSSEGGGLAKGGVPLPMSAHDLEKEVQRRIAPISEAALKDSRSPSLASAIPGSPAPHLSAPAGTDVSLIGTVGTRAVLLLPSGQTLVAKTGDEFETMSGTAKLVSVLASSADIKIGDKQVTLPLKAASWLVSMAVEQAKQEQAAAKKPASSSEKQKAIKND